jgi:hypothetical protein
MMTNGADETLPAPLDVPNHPERTHYRLGQFVLDRPGAGLSMRIPMDYTK